MPATWASRPRSLSEMWGEVQRAAGAMERLVELERGRCRHQGADAAGRAAAAAQGPHPVRRTCVSAIRRGPKRAALDDFTVTIEPGETVAFVGPSGAGKSTTFQLLLRFYDPADGPRADRRRRRRARAIREHVRAMIGLVPQDTVLFGASARENIRYGRPERERRGDRGGGARRRGRRVHPRVAARLRHVSRRARHAAFGRAAATHRDRAGDPQGSADSAARRGDELARRAQRAARAAGARAAHGSSAPRSSSRTGSRPCRKPTASS